MFQGSWDPRGMCIHVCHEQVIAVASLPSGSSPHGSPALGTPRRSPKAAVCLGHDHFRDSLLPGTPWGGLPAVVDNRCQGGRESQAPCAHRLPSGQQEGASKAPEMCLRPGQPLTCWGWQSAWGLETWPTKLPSSCLAEAWLGQGAEAASREYTEQPH